MPPALAPPKARSTLPLIASLLLTCASSVAILAFHGEPSSRLGLQAASGVVGASLVFALAASPGRPTANWLPPLALACLLLLLAATLLGSGTLGVRRWILLGSSSLHVSAIVSPVFVATSAAWLGRPGRSLSLLLAAQGIHVLQPDAGQATAFGLAAGVLVAHAPWRLSARVGGGIALFLLVGLSWIRPDPLEPVPSVEGIVALAAQIGGPCVLLALFAVFSMPLAIAAVSRTASPDDRLGRVTALALAAYVVGCVVVGLVGNYPVPVLGFGASPILGVALSMGLAARAITYRAA